MYVVNQWIEVHVVSLS